MWNIWKEELYKIASRKIVWLGVFLLLAFLSFRLFAERDHYTTVIDGKVYHGQEAIQKDQALTKLYAGALTKEKILQIYNEYGFYYYDEKTDATVGNYCSRFITEQFTNYMQTNGDDPEALYFYPFPDDIVSSTGNHTAEYSDSLIFDYVYGWNDFAEIYIMALLVLFVILIIGLSPLFAEEYQLRTADILKTTRHGKQSGIWMKVLAASIFAAALTCIVSVFLWILYLTMYGTQGLDASAVLLNFANFYGYSPKTILGFCVFVALLGLTGALLLTGIISGISAFCRTPFLALILSLVVFFFPVLWLKVLAPLFGFGTAVTKNITHFMTSMPVYLPMTTGFAFPARQIIIHLCIALITGIIGILLGYHRFRNT